MVKFLIFVIKARARVLTYSKIDKMNKLEIKLSPPFLETFVFNYFTISVSYPGDDHPVIK